MATFTVSGHSDDCLELDGDFYEEWSYCEGHSGDRVRLSDGTVLRVRYDEEGRWRITVEMPGSATVSIVPCPTSADDPDDKYYTDVATVTGAVEWVEYGDEHAEPRVAR